MFVYTAKNVHTWIQRLRKFITAMITGDNDVYKNNVK